MVSLITICSPKYFSLPLDIQEKIFKEIKAIIFLTLLLSNCLLLTPHTQTKSRSFNELMTTYCLAVVLKRSLGNNKSSKRTRRYQHWPISFKFKSNLIDRWHPFRLIFELTLFYHLSSHFIRLILISLRLLSPSREEKNSLVIKRIELQTTRRSMSPQNKQGTAK